MSEPYKLNDDCPMPFGKHRGKRLGDVPDHYWLWFLKQDWCRKYPDLIQYAQTCEKDSDDD